MSRSASAAAGAAGGRASAGAGWAIVAHAVGGALIGLIEAARLDSLPLGLALVPLVAATGLLAGAVIGGLGGLARRWPRPLAALALAAPTLAVTGPIAWTLFDGPYARTLPGAAAMPVLVPLAVWLGAAAAAWLGGWLAAGDLLSRAIAILGVGGAIGAILRVERALPAGGYPGARIGATLAVIVLAGALVRLAARPRVPAYAAAAVAGLVLGAAVASAQDGLAGAAERRLLADRGDLGRDLVRLWRGILDRDRDGSSALLGGGDCDDGDPAIHPGALDTPGDGIDQDCDGADAVRVTPPAAPAGGDRAVAAAGAAALIERTRGMSVLILAIDALRYDLLAPGAPHREDFPRLARLLDESVRFDRVIAPAAGTDIALSTILTGHLDPFTEIAVTLPEAMRALGRRTITVLPREVTRYVGEVMLDRGVDRPRRLRTDGVREDVGDHITAGATTDEGLREIAAAEAEAPGRPWYAWLHYFDVHESHQIPVPAELLAEVAPGGSERAHRYRALLRAVDGEIGRALDELAARGLAERTIIWLVSDHGESLEGDPRMPQTHGNVAYTPLVRVPLAVRIPGAPPGIRIDPISLADLAPTMLALAGAPGAMGPLDGFDLVPAIIDGPAALRPPPSRALVIHEAEQWSVVEWPYQVIVRPADDLVELYDLERDPLDRHDLAPARPELARRLRARYAEVPPLRVDRSPAGRAWREQRARRPPPPAPR